MARENHFPHTSMLSGLWAPSIKNTRSSGLSISGIICARPCKVAVVVGLWWSRKKSNGEGSYQVRQIHKTFKIAILCVRHHSRPPSASTTSSPLDPRLRTHRLLKRPTVYSPRSALIRNHLGLYWILAILFMFWKFEALQMLLYNHLGIYLILTIFFLSW